MADWTHICEENLQDEMASNGSSSLHEQYIACKQKEDVHHLENKHCNPIDGHKDNAQREGSRVGI